MDEKLVYIGNIIDIKPILNADMIESATVVCGQGGKWTGIIQKGQFNLGDLCIVYLPDSIIPESEELAFMKSSNWRVRMKRFRGAASEVLITKYPSFFSLRVGTDITKLMSVKRYLKPISACLSGQAKGDFPSFIPKTDEPNYQKVPDLYEIMHGKPFYVSLKMDGSSTTAYKWNDNFGVCSRNLELKESESNGYWVMANKYNLKEKLPEGYAIQWETCGPGIQSNPMGLTQISAFAFSGYDIAKHEYLNFHDLTALCMSMGMPMCEIVSLGNSFTYTDVSDFGEGLYANGAQREGVVVRTQNNIGHAPISFKVINLNYDETNTKSISKNKAA